MFCVEMAQLKNKLERFGCADDTGSSKGVLLPCRWCEKLYICKRYEELVRAYFALPSS